MGVAYRAEIHRRRFRSSFACMTIDSSDHTRVFITVKQPNQSSRDRVQLKRLVFYGVFCLWAKPRLPPDIASADPRLAPNSGSGSDAIVVLDRPAAASHATDITGLESGDDFLRSCLNTEISSQGAVPLGLILSCSVHPS